MKVNNFIRPTRIEVNVGAIKHNIQLIRELISPQTKILLPVKADAYGHGAVAVASYVQAGKLVDVLGVAAIEEGVELRENGITLPILVLGAILPEQQSAETIVRYNLMQSVSDSALAKTISQAAQKFSARARVHIKVDTGMHRIGISPALAGDLAEQIVSDPHVELVGLFSHMPLSDEFEHAFNKKQITEFTRLAKEIKQRIPSLCVHLSNSAALLNFREADFSMVRPGILSYGYPPCPNCAIKPVPAMRMVSAIVENRRVSAGEAISYGHTYTAKKQSVIATIPVGYGDGYLRALSNKAEILIGKKRYPVAGRVCMDLMMIDCGDDEYPCGTEVEIFGSGEITAETLAQLAGTISYEITCAPSSRVPRVYLDLPVSAS